MSIRLDLHVHSCYPPDSRLEVKTILKVARERGLTGVAITEHRTVPGGVAAAEAKDDPSFLIIPGAAYATDAGHILALFLNSDLPLAGQGPLPWPFTTRPGARCSRPPALMPRIAAKFLLSSAGLRVGRRRS